MIMNRQNRKYYIMVIDVASQIDTRYMIVFGVSISFANLSIA